MKETVRLNNNKIYLLKVNDLLQKPKRRLSNQNSFFYLFNEGEQWCNKMNF